MKGSIYERCKKEADYMIKEKATVRQTAKKMKLSKSTIHEDITKRLEAINPMLAKEVEKVLAENKAKRHIRGGIATKKKYARLRAKK